MANRPDKSATTETETPDQTATGRAAADYETGAQEPAGDVAPETGAGPEPQAEDAAGAAPEPDALEARIAELEEERDALKDRLMRALAETENLRRRAERERKDAEAYGGTRLARDMLSVHDNLARALAAADESLRRDHAKFLEGVELTQRELLNAFAKHRIEKLTPEKGEKFDPNRHQAMFEVPMPGAEPGTVCEVMQEGFVIADRLLRPALVGIAKAPPKPEPAPETEGGDESEAPSDPPDSAA